MSIPVIFARYGEARFRELETEVLADCGKRSGIILSTGGGVGTTRHMIQHVVTEYGVAHLRGRNLAERARALIAIAHPSVREELERAAAERFGYSFLRLH